jgi:hypothetical protein
MLTVTGVYFERCKPTNFKYCFQVTKLTSLDKIRELFLLVNEGLGRGAPVVGGPENEKKTSWAWMIHDDDKDDRHGAMELKRNNGIGQKVGRLPFCRSISGFGTLTMANHHE